MPKSISPMIPEFINRYISEHFTKTSIYMGKDGHMILSFNILKHQVSTVIPKEVDLSKYDNAKNYADLLVEEIAKTYKIQPLI